MKRPWQALLPILVLSALLAAGYAHATPVGAAADEGAHLEYVRVLAAGGPLPVMDLERRRRAGREDTGYEAHQPPLYYALAVPFYRVGSAMGGTEGAAQGCRLLSILLGAVGTGLVWLLARALAPERPALWLAAAGIAAFLPMRLAVMASVSNDALAEVGHSLVLLLLLNGMARGWSDRGALALGLALGGALLARQAGILLLPPVLAGLYAGCRRGRDGAAAARAFLRVGAVAAGAALLLAGWWFARNQTLYGDPLGHRLFNEYFEDTRRWVDFRDQLGWSFGEYLWRMVLPTSFASFWGAFGHLERPELFMGALGPGYPPPSWVYRALLAATAVAAAGGVWYYGRLRLRPDGSGLEELANPRAGLLALHAVFVLAAFMNFNATYFQGQGRYLFPAIGILAAGLAGGWLEWCRRREGPASVAIVTAAFALAVYALFGVLRPAFEGA